MIPGKIEILIAKELSGNISPGERRTLQAWLDESKQHAQIYLEYVHAWERSGSSQQIILPDIEQEFSKLRSTLKLHDGSPHNTRRIPGSIRQSTGGGSRQKWIAWAAAAILFILINSIFIYHLIFSEITVSTKFAETKSLDLPDGSSVRLNCGSTISYSRNRDRDSRFVHLTGEAFFQIKPMNIPFIVQTENSVIQVLGTEFNVRTYDQVTEVIVREGVVSFRSLIHHDSEVILKANETSVCDGQSPPATVESVDSYKQIGWLTNRIIFKKRTLRQAVNELIRVYGVHIKIDISQQKTATISGSFEEKTIDEVLEAICSVFELQYTKKADSYIIHEEGIL